MVGESYIYGKCIVRTLLLGQTHFSLLNIKMQTKLKDVQASFLISFTSWYSLAFLHFFSFCISFLFNSLQDTSFCTFLHYQRTKL